MARVEDVFTGDDGIVRSARVRTKLGTYVRPVVKLAPVPIDVPRNRAGDVNDSRDSRVM
jgi:hypothetical protein